MNADTLEAIKVTLIALPTMFVVTTIFIVACKLLVKVFPAAQTAARVDNERAAA